MQSPRLQFSRSGRFIAVADEGGVTAVPLSASSVEAVHHLALPSVAALAAFDDQIWALDGERRHVHRWTADGATLGAPVPVSVAPCTDWWVVPTGAPAVLVEGAAGRVALVDDLGALTEQVVDTAGVAIPVSGRRHVICDDRLVRLGGGVTARLGDGVRVLAGAVLFDGTAVALVVVRAGTPGPSALVLSTSSGTLQQRVALPEGEVRVAPRRGVALVQIGRRKLVAIDLRFGTTLGTIEHEAEIDDFAVDAEALRVAVRAGVELRVHALRDWLRGGEPAPERAIQLGAQAAAEPAPIEIMGSGPIELPPPPTELAAQAPLPRPLELRAFGRAPEGDAVARAEALGLLDRELETVGLWALVAVAKGWDTRRIGFANESAHPHEMEVAAILGMNEGHARDHLAGVRERLAVHERAIAPVEVRRRAATPIGALAAELGLSPLAVDILLIIAAPSLWGDAARLYGILANDPARALVDEVLVQHVLGDERASRHDVAHELDPRQPLVKYGLVHVTGRARPFASLTVDPVVLARLRAEPLDPDPSSPTRVRRADRALDDVLIPRDRLLAALRYLGREPAPDRGDRHARIALHGRIGSGRRTLLAALAAEAGRDVAVIDATRLPRKPLDLAAALRDELQRARLRGLVPCVAGLDELVFEEQGAREVIDDVLRTHPGPLALRLAPGAKVPFEPGYLAIELPLPSEGERLAVWQAALADRGLAVHDAAVLAARYRVGPGTIRGVVDGVAAARADEGRADDGDATDEIEARMRQTREILLGEHARRVERLATWSSLVLPPDVVDSLRELIGRVRHRRTVYERWGFDRAMSTSRGLTALFQGPPGTGKTMVAGVIARELGLDLYQVDLSKVMSKWLGETERNLASIFDAAEDGQMVLLFDEADSLFAKRTEVKSSHDRYANLEVNYLLQRLDAFEGIAILTTNFGGAIDPAFKRRLSFRLSLPFPDEETREQLWRVHLPPEMPVAGALDLAALAKKYQLAGGYIRNACLRAAFLAAQAESPLTQQHLDRAVALEFAELGKLSTTGTVE